MRQDTSICRGRFAPSPTGPLHFGSLVAAVASYCEARAPHSGEARASRSGEARAPRSGEARAPAPGDTRTDKTEWLLRIEDVDTPRTVAGASDSLLATLEALGFEWDGPVVYQSRRTEAYAAALERLRAAGAVFACACTRKEIADSMLRAAAPADEIVYPGTCRDGIAPGRSARSIRARVGSGSVEFLDAVQGPIAQDLARDIGDFIVRRADGLFAYQLAVVVDDADAGITDVVRGSDLLGSTPRQIVLQRLLGLSTPRYAHVPVAMNAAGEKLSKQTLAPAIDPRQGAPALARALGFLGQPVPAELGRAPVHEIWDWALACWSLDRVPRERALRA